MPWSVSFPVERTTPDGSVAFRTQNSTHSAMRPLIPLALVYVLTDDPQQLYLRAPGDGRFDGQARRDVAVSVEFKTDFQVSSS